MTVADPRGAGMSEEDQRTEQARLQEVDVEIEKRVFGRTTYQYRQTPYLTLADHHDGRGAIYKIPAYSTDITAAWLVIDRMRDLGWCFGVKDDASLSWLARFDNLNGLVWWGRADTAPLAIVRAALEALQ